MGASTHSNASVTGAKPQETAAALCLVLTPSQSQQLPLPPCLQLVRLDADAMRARCSDSNGRGAFNP